MAKTIVVADDSKTIRHALALTFKTTEFEVVSVGDGEAALSRVKEMNPAIVLADVAMPGRDGYALCRAIKAEAKTAHVPVLLLAGSFEPFDEAKAKDAGANGHIKKPFDTESLINRVKELTSAEAMAQAQSFAATLTQKQPQPAPQRAPSTAQGAPRAAQPAEAQASPFGAPRSEPVAARPQAAPPRVPPAARAPSADEIAFDMNVGSASPAGGPTLEPPPSPAEVQAKKNIDPWAFAEPVQTKAPLEAPQRGPADARARQMAANMAEAVAPTIAAAVSVPGLSSDQLTAIARDAIERIAWEVVPDLAETIIRTELKRLLAE